MITQSVDLDINELLRISQKILQYQEAPGFRTVDVFCVSKTGQKILFAAPEQVQKQLVGLMTNFRDLLSKSHDLGSYAKAFSVFWLGFIAIHPFINGNGRTAKEYLQNKIQESGLALSRMELLDGILLLGDLSRDLSLLQDYFLTHLSYKRKTL